MREIFLEDQKKCMRVSSNQWRKRPATQKIKESLVRLLSPVL
ncbi:hypothetical protein [uncultured Muribaculum sp.]|nr:hypothetical protein [uncultured Muribaculum sp.]